MNEDQLTRLRNRLQRKRQRLEATNGLFFHQTLQRFRHFLETDPFLAPIIDELKLNQKASDNATFFLKKIEDRSTIAAARPFFDSATQEDHIPLLYQLILYALQHVNNITNVTQALYGSQFSYHLDNYSGYKNEVLVPFCDYLEERLDEQQSLVGLLIRYKKRCEWFNRQELSNIAKKEIASKGDDKKRAEVEDVLKLDLYRYLHDQGLEFTIEPYSHKGRIDLILDQKEGVRKYLEGKVFDNKNRDAAYIIKGFGQLLNYLHQYHAHDGYLLVYMTCENQLVIDGDGHLGQIPFVRCEGKKVFILVVDVFLHRKPVSQRLRSPIHVTADQLCKSNKPK